MPGGNKKVTHSYTNLHQNAERSAASMCDLFVTTRYQRVKLKSESLCENAFNRITCFLKM